MGFGGVEDPGHEYTPEEQATFARLIVETHMTTTTVGTLLKAKTWPGLLFSTLTELKRATRQKKLEAHTYMAHAFKEDGGGSDSDDDQASALLITDDKEEDKQCELAWDWPRRRDKVQKQMAEKMAVPNLLANDLVDEWSRAAKIENESQNRRMAAYMANNRPQPSSIKPRNLLRSLADLALADATCESSNDATTIDALVGAAWALDRSKEETKGAAVHAAFHASAFAFDHRAMPQSPPYTDDDVFDLARHLLSVRKGFRVNHNLDDPRDVACEGALGILRELLGSDSSAARCAACAALADCARYADGARSLGPALAVFVAPLIPSPAPAARRMKRSPVSAGDLGPLLACAAVGELASRDHAMTRPALIKAGAVENLVRAILDALNDAKDLGGDASCASRLIPRYALKALCFLTEDPKARKRAMDAGAVEGCKRLVARDVDAKSATVRIGKRDALRFLASCMTFTEGHALDVCMAPGVMSLCRAREVVTRNAAFRSLLFIAQHTEEPSYLVNGDTGLLEAMEDGLEQYTLRGTVLRLVLVLAKYPAAQAELKRHGLADVITDVAEDPSNSVMNRGLAVRIMFTMGEEAFFNEGTALACAGKDKDFRKEIKEYEKLIRDRKAQVAYEVRPEEEHMFEKHQLKAYKRLFNAYSQGHGQERFVDTKTIRDLLRRCCAEFKDWKARRAMTKKNVARCVTIYDADGSGAIEWDEFLNIMHDMTQGAFLDRVSGWGLF